MKDRDEDDSSKVDVGYFTKNKIDPHVYELLALAYKDLDVGDGKGGEADEAILVLGEWGTGKTEMVKIAAPGHDPIDERMFPG